MGDRGQVKIIDSWDETKAVYLYTHWGATYLIEDVHRALSRRARWDDSCYLARIIFCEMLHGDLDGETGYGICTNQHGDIWRLIEVDCKNQRIRVIDLGEVILDCSFAEFVESSLELLDIARSLGK
ncbi:MAG: hypothetical protein ACTSRU_21345 [Candidatus Hodarchaeales archaeon]